MTTIGFGINVAKVMGFIKEIVRVVGKILTQVVLTLEKVIMSQLRHHGNVYFLNILDLIPEFSYPCK